jgi:hypothetical protein
MTDTPTGKRLVLAPTAPTTSSLAVDDSVTWTIPLEITVRLGRATPPRAGTVAVGEIFCGTGKR